MRKRQHRLPITKAELTLLGEIAFHMSMIEFNVQDLIWHFLKLESPKGLLITGPMQLNQKLDLLSGLVGQLRKKDKQLEEIISAIEHIRPERNRKLHAFWVWDENWTRSALLLGSDRKSQKVVPVSKQDIIKARDDIYLAEIRLTTWMFAHGILPPKLPRKFVRRHRA